MATGATLEATEMLTAETLEAYAEALAPAFPEGVPLAELAFLLSLASDRREAVLARVEAVLAAERHDADLGAIATGVGLGRTQFYALRRRWASQRALRSLAPYQPRRARVGINAGKLDADPPSRAASESSPTVATVARNAVERAAAIKAIVADPLAENGKLARLVAARTGSGLDERTLVRIVQRERRLLHFEPRLLVGIYGRSVLADVSAMDLALDVDGAREIAMIALMVERASTLIVGHAVGTRGEAIDLQVRAARRAVAFLSDHCADVAADTAVGMQIVIGPGSAAAQEELRRSVVRSLGEDAIVGSGRLRFGHRMAALIGQPGRVRLRPMATQPSVEHPFDPAAIEGSALSVDQADALLGAEIERHNRRVVEGLKRVGLFGGGERHGAMARVLEDVFADSEPA